MTKLGKATLKDIVDVKEIEKVITKELPMNYDGTNPGNWHILNKIAQALSALPVAVKRLGDTGLLPKRKLPIAFLDKKGKEHLSPDDWVKKGFNECHSIASDIEIPVVESKLRPLNKEEFRYILCEFPPSIAKDSGQPEWTQGEVDKVWDCLTAKKRCILTHDMRPQSKLEYKSLYEHHIAEMKDKDKEIKELKEALKRAHEVFGAESDKLGKEIIELNTQNSIFKEKLTNMMKAFRPAPKLAQGELIPLDRDKLYTDVNNWIQYKIDTGTDYIIDIDRDDILEIVNTLYDKFGTAHKPKIDEGKMNGGLRPLGTTGNYTDSMGNLYSKQ